MVLAKITLYIEPYKHVHNKYPLQFRRWASPEPRQSHARTNWGRTKRSSPPKPLTFLPQIRTLNFALHFTSVESQYKANRNQTIVVNVRAALHRIIEVVITKNSGVYDIHFLRKSVASVRMCVCLCEKNQLPKYAQQRARSA